MSIRFYQPAKQLTQRIETRPAVTNLSTIRMFEPYAPVDTIDVDASAICNIPIVETPQNNLDYLVYRTALHGIAWEPFAPGPDGMTGMTGPGGVTGPATNPFNFNVETVSSPSTALDPNVAISFLNVPTASLTAAPVLNGQMKTIININPSVPTFVTAPGGLIVYDGLNYGLLQFNALGSAAKLLWSDYIASWILIARNNVSIA